MISVRPSIPIRRGRRRAEAHLLLRRLSPQERIELECLLRCHAWGMAAYYCEERGAPRRVYRVYMISEAANAE